MQDATVFSPGFFLVAGFAITLIGISKSGFAGGLGVLGVPLMALYVSPQLALAIQMPLLILMDLANCWRYWRSWSRPVVLALLPSALLGLLCGAAMFQVADSSVLKAMVGTMALYTTGRFFLGYAVAKKAKQWSYPLISVAGFICGFAGIVAHAGGPAIKGYLLSLNMEKSMFVGTNSMFFLFLNFVKGGIYGALSQYSTQSLMLSLQLVPFLVLGVFLGFRFHKMVSQSVFMNLAYGLLGLAGLRLIWDVAIASQ